jgi:hypothetical protein
MSKLLIMLFVLSGSVLFAQGPSDAEIQTALERGQNTPAKKLWSEIRKNHEYRITRAGLDPIEKKVVLLSDLDRISLEAAEAKRQLRNNFSVEDIKNNLPLGVLEVLLEANCYNSMYAGSLPKWGPAEGVHLVLKVNETVVQPIEKKTGKSDAVSILPQQHGVVTKQGNAVTYTPLYQTAIYERSTLRSWFTFPQQPSTVKSFVVTAISGDGKQKEKEVPNPAK